MLTPPKATLALDRLARVRLEAIKGVVFLILCFGHNPQPHPHITVPLGRN